jgi:hypothetical protein
MKYYFDFLPLILEPSQINVVFKLLQMRVVIYHSIELLPMMLHILWLLLRLKLIYILFRALLLDLFFCRCGLSSESVFIVKIFLYLCDYLYLGFFKFNGINLSYELSHTCTLIHCIHTIDFFP